MTRIKRKKEGERHNGPPFGLLRGEERREEERRGEERRGEKKRTRASARAHIIARLLGGAREHESEQASERYGASFIHPTEWSLNLN